MEYVVEETRNIPVLLEADVVVAGAGSAGPIAAIAAARQGSRTILIERFGALGGNLTIGLNTKPSGLLFGGIPGELWERGRSMNIVGREDILSKLEDGSSIGFAAPCDPEMMKILLWEMCSDSGVKILPEVFASKPIFENNKLKGVIIESKEGRHAILAKMLVDATADGDIAAAAGAPYIIGSSEGKMQPVSLFFKMNDVDVEKLVDWAKNNPEHVSKYGFSGSGISFGVWLSGFTKLLREFQKKNGIKLQREYITLKTGYGPHEVFVNSTRVIGMSGIAVLDISKSIGLCYQQIKYISTFLKEYVPGYKKAYINGISPMLGVRETRHFLGEYFLTGKDVQSGTHFEDSITVDIAAMDIHSVDSTLLRFESQKAYEIPYRCLVPKKIDQILLAGRCISTNHEAHGRTRNIPACMSTGQAAGIAAALSIKESVSPRNLNVKLIQDELDKINATYYISQMSNQ